MPMQCTPCTYCRQKINEQIFHKSKSAHASDKKINSRVARDIEKLIADALA